MPANEPNRDPDPAARTGNSSADPGYELVEELPRARRVRPAGPLAKWVRVWLLILAGGGLLVLGIALWLNPYNADGSRKSMATHTQLGLPPCNMVVMTGKPCPACGMTTSFSLLAHGDVVGSAKANWVGTLMAAFGAALIPWAVVSAARGKYLFVRSGELLMTVAMVVFTVLMAARWAVVLLQ